MENNAFHKHVKSSKPHTLDILTQNYSTIHKHPKILIIGALPPPFIGPFIANKRLLEAEELQSNFEIIFCDISDRRSGSNMGKLDFWNIVLALTHIIKFLRLLFIHRPQIVYGVMSGGLWGWIRDLSFFLPTALFRRKLILHLRGSELNELYESLTLPIKLLTRYVLQKTTRMIVLGGSIKNKLGDSLIDTDKIQVIPNGINYRVFDNYHNGHFDTSNTPFKILFLSSLRKRKGIFQFLESIPLVIKKHANVHFSIAGEWRVESEKQDAQNLLEKHKIQKYITFTGQVTGDQKIKLFKEHHLFVFPPIEPEGLPWVILEAMSAALPVIATNQGAIAEVVDNGRTGYIVTSDPVDIASKICYLIEHPYITLEMHKNSRKRVEQLFSEKKYLEDISELFQRVLVE